jgi:hypothetical protein
LSTIGTFDATGQNVSYRGAAQERSTTDLGRIADHRAGYSVPAGSELVVESGRDTLLKVRYCST